MLFWLFVIILVISAVGGYILYEKYDLDGALIFCYFIAICMAIFIIISGFIMIISHGAVDAKVAANVERYESLTYQLENDLYDNDNDLGKKELYDEIREWNEDVVYYQNIQDNFWFGIYYPNIFDQFKTIEYEAHI